VHVFAGGRIVQSGGAELADELEAEGYVKYTGAPETAAAPAAATAG
jgi:Fe-S cluster assembly ATP-binding protein